MSVLGLNSKDRKSARDKANISNPKVNRGCAPLTANRTSADCVQISWTLINIYSTGGLPYWGIQRYGASGMNKLYQIYWCLCISISVIEPASVIKYRRGRGLGNGKATSSHLPGGDMYYCQIGYIS